MLTIRQFYLTKLAEECNEVGQRALKQQQFGQYEVQKNQALNNEDRLRAEVLDLYAMVRILTEAGEIPRIYRYDMEEAYEAKKAKIAKYLAYSQDLGKVERV